MSINDYVRGKVIRVVKSKGQITRRELLRKLSSTYRARADKQIEMLVSEGILAVTKIGTKVLLQLVLDV